MELHSDKTGIQGPSLALSRVEGSLHKLTPMPGVHKGLQPTPQFVGSTRSGGENSIRPGFRGAAEPRCSVTEAKHGRIR